MALTFAHYLPARALAHQVIKGLKYAAEARLKARSGLNVIRDRAGRHFFAVQGERSAVDRASTTDDQRGN
jgi:hypothetical protein